MLNTNMCIPNRGEIGTYSVFQIGTFSGIAVPSCNQHETATYIGEVGAGVHGGTRARVARGREVTTGARLLSHSEILLVGRVRVRGVSPFCSVASSVTPGLAGETARNLNPLYSRNTYVFRCIPFEAQIGVESGKRGIRIPVSKPQETVRPSPEWVQLSAIVTTETSRVARLKAERVRAGLSSSAYGWMWVAINGQGPYMVNTPGLLKRIRIPMEYVASADGGP